MQNPHFYFRKYMQNPHFLKPAFYAESPFFRLLYQTQKVDCNFCGNIPAKEAIPFFTATFLR